jgi:hypothetical protein
MQLLSAYDLDRGQELPDDSGRICIGIQAARKARGDGEAAVIK